jgi:hypothetical protein
MDREWAIAVVEGGHGTNKESWPSIDKKEAPHRCGASFVPIDE